MTIYVGGINNDMIKSSDNCRLYIVVDSVTKKFMLSDTTLRSFIPPQVHKITPILCHICECDICIITNYIHIDLNIFRTNIVKYLP